MANLVVREAEEIVNSFKAQLAKGFPQTVGTLHLTNQRVVLIPNQLLSVGFGKKLELESSSIVEIRPLQNFEGGTFSGGAGKKIFIRLQDGTAYTFACWLTADVDAICTNYKNALGLNSEGVGTSEVAASSLFDDTVDTLLNLKELLDSGLLSNDEYAAKRSELVSRL